MNNIFDFVLNEHEKIVASQNVTNEWKQYLLSVKDVAFDQDKKWKEFLKQPAILQSMFMNAQGSLMQHQLNFLLRKLPEEVLQGSLPEPNVGSPPTKNISGIEISHNTVHHLYHLARYVHRNDLKTLFETKSFVEWGGGYGNFARLVKTINPAATYTIIDLPIFSLIQYRYLCEVFGEDHVVFLTPDMKTVEGKINLLPSSYWNEVDISTDFFISTWALSESPIEVQNLVFEKLVSATEHGLFSFHQCGYHIPFMKQSINLFEQLKVLGYSFDDVKVIPGKNFYAFR